MSTIEQSRPTLPTGTWKVDPVHSQLGFEVEYLVGTFRGTFSPFEATLEVDEDGNAALRGSTRVESVKVQDENLTAHLQSPDFFDAERAPELGFASTAIRAADDGLAIEGELSLRNATRPVELRGTVGEPGVDPWGKERIRLTLTGTIDRTAFGLDWNNPLPSGEPALANDVTLTAELFLVKA